MSHTLIDLLRMRAERQPDLQGYTFLCDGERQERGLTYAELDRQARAIAAELARPGARGERALLLYPPGLDYIASFFGCLYAGIVAVPIYPPDPARLARTLPRLLAVVADAQATVVLTTSEILGVSELLFEQAPALRALRWLATDGLDPAGAAGFRDPGARADSVAFLQYTSGSTAAPRGVMLTHANLLDNLSLIERAFGHSPASRGVIWLPPYHDMGLIGGVLQPLHAGFPVVLFSPLDFLKRPLRWLQVVSRYGATTSGGPNFAYDLCARKIGQEERQGLDLSRWEVAFNGAEPIRADTMRRFAEVFAPCGFRPEAFFPCYGLAEATLMVSGGHKSEAPIVRWFDAAALQENRAAPAPEAPEARTLVSSGRCLAGHDVRITHPVTGAPCPPGQVGEIRVSGPSVALGYWGRPEETGRTFEAPPSGGGAPLLHTGDLGFLLDGELFVTGRLKDLIILHGRNHYPQDIEQAAERCHASLRRGGGAAFSVDVDGEERLVIVQEVERAAEGQDLAGVAEEIRRGIAEALEIQVHDVVLVRAGTIPKTSSGKIQRRECREALLAGSLAILHRSLLTGRAAEEAPAPEPAGALRAWLDAPAGIGERRALVARDLAARAARALRLPAAQVDADRPLVAMGLDSLAAVSFKGEVEAALGVELPLAELFTGVTLAELTERILARRELDPALPDVEAPAMGGAGEAPLSGGQQALWFMHQVAPGSAAYHVPIAARLRAPLDVPALRRALEALVARHPALRTTFAETPAGPVQRVHERMELDLEEVDAGSFREAELGARLSDEASRPFDLERGPLLRVRVLRRAPEEHVLLVVMHHIITDLWSIAVLAEELGALYPAARAGREAELLPPGTTAVEHARREARTLAGPRGSALAAYWSAELAGLPELALPTDRRRPPSQSFRGRVHAARFSAELLGALKALARDRGATLGGLLQAAFQVLLHRMTGQEDLAIGVVSAGRGAPELARVVGYFVNPLVVRVRPCPRQTFASFLEHAQRALLGALTHHDYPFSAVVDRLQPARDQSRSPLFQVMFAYQGGQPLDVPGLSGFALDVAGARADIGGLPLESMALDRRAAQMDLTLTMGEIDGALAASFEYATDLFEADTIARMAERLDVLLRGIAADPERRLRDLPLLPADERRWIEEISTSTLGGSAGTSPAAPPNSCAPPPPVEATVPELFAAQAARAPDAAAVLWGEARLSYGELSLGAGRVAAHLRAVGVGRGSVVGICMARSPALVIATLGVLLAGAAYVPLDPEAPSERRARILADACASCVLTEDAVRGALDGGEPAPEPDSAGPARIGPRDLACVVYTSGSTGQPKGVMMEHLGLSNLVRSFVDSYQVGPADRILPLTAVSSASFVGEILPLLCAGGAVVLPREGELLDSEALLELMRRAAVTIVSAVPALVVELNARRESLPPVRLVLSGGEALVAGDVARLLEVAEVVNGYGLTETTVCSTFLRVRREDLAASGWVPVGRPIADTHVHVLDAHLNVLPAGCPGELYIGGAGVSRGYLGRPGLTAERFVPDPFRPGERMYRTGDVGRWLREGVLEYLHRADEQVKIRGHRVEPGEIEAALKAHPGVRDAAVIAREDAPGDRRLVAYVVPAGAAPTSSALHAWLAERLPAPLLPSAFVLLPALPLSPHGKVDAQALPAPEGERPALDAVYTPPQSALERRIAAIWQEVLQVDRVGVHDPFFELGGNSLRLSAVHRRLREDLGADLSLVEMFQYATVSALARRLGRGRGTEAAAVERPSPGEAGQRRPAPGVEREAIAIVGVACRFPGARTPSELWKNLCEGVESISFFTEEELIEAGVDPAQARASNYVRARGVLGDTDQFDAAFFGLSPSEAALMDPQHRLFLECAWEALESAGYSPDRKPGRVGVFGGVSMNTYLLTNVYGHLAHVASVESLQASIGNDKDSLTTEVAYRMDLTGPAVTVQSSSSTSLVVIHYACQSLLGFECDMALAGGVSIHFPEKAGYLYYEGGTTSPDGHCRAFDADAKGFVAGHGAGVVVLRRLSDALAAGDTIYAVIKGSAVNNDGAAKVSYMAPSVEGQAEVIALAQAAAGVMPDSVDYVEAHGTATPLGDPIELTALARAFRRGTERRGFCALGSIKTNIGHLDAAAGVAGLIKATLSLHHGLIPPSLHFQRPNPAIDLESSPFFVNTRLLPWPRGEKPRRAGVTSLGMGGTNAHCILEEAPAPPPADPPRRPAELLLLSARTGPALEAATDRLVEHLEAHRDLSLADVAYTLQVGRRRFEQRRALVCAGVDDAIAALRSRGPARVQGGAGQLEGRPVMFMFSGQGSQYVDMGRGLYEVEPVFRAEIDACAERLRHLIGLDLRSVLYPPAARRDEAAEQLRQTALAQPALFAIEIALARLWMSWGVTPRAMIGHSVGELVAACLAGVFSLEDALALVAARGRLMQALPPGAMLAVPLAEGDLLPLLGAGLSLAAVNGPSACVIAGPAPAVDALEAELSARGIPARRLHTSHAFHSAMMDPILDAFRAEVARVPRSAPQIPYLSNVTGTWITADEVRSPDVWARHLRGTVRFSAGLGELLREEDAVLLEVGPGQVLATFARQHPARQAQHVVVASTRHPQGKDRDLDVLLAALGRLWVAGIDPDWDTLHRGERRRRLPLPTAPFERRRHWVEPRARERAGAAATAEGKLAMDRWFSLPCWKPSPAPPAGAWAGEKARWWLLVPEREGEEGLGDRVARRLAGAGHEAVLIRLADPAGLPERLAAAGPGPDRVLHLGLMGRGGASPASTRALGFEALIHVARALASLEQRPRAIVVATHRMQAIGGERPDPEQALVLGPCRVIPQEHPHLACRAVDVELPPAGSHLEAALIERLCVEAWAAGPGERVVAYRGRQRWVEGFEPITARGQAGSPSLRRGGVYVILGGLGTLGYSHARALARAAQAKLVLVGRTALPERAAWAAWLSRNDPGDPVSRRIHRIEALAALGAEVLPLCADVADRAQLAAALEAARARFGALHGVVLAAGAVDGELFQPLMDLGWAEVEACFRARVQGVQALAEVLGEAPLDFVLLGSSLASRLGGAGRAAYAAATSFMDAFALRQGGEGSAPWISVGWDAWRPEAGAGAPLAAGQLFGELAITPDEGEEALLRVLELQGVAQAVVSTSDLDARIAREARPAAPPAAETPVTAPAPRGPRQGAHVAPRDELEEAIAHIWESTLGVAQIGVSESFFELGGNSLVGVKVIDRLRERYKVRIPAVILYEQPTVEAMARWLREAMAGAPAQAPGDGDDESSARGERRRARRRRRATEGAAFADGGDAPARGEGEDEEEEG